jgi:DNA polymerase-4
MNLYNRSIIHLNVADFAVAVERAVDRRLDERPVIIAPEGAARAAVYDMSNEAYMTGIRKGMALQRAVHLCKDVKILPPHPDRYELAMRDVLRRALPYSPLIETGEDDGHLFMDTSGTTRLFGPPMDVARRLRKQIKTDLGLNPIWSVAPNKLVAKVATRLVKPDGEYVVSAGEEQSLLAPLPVSLVPGIERNDQLRLREFNLVRVFQVSALSLEQLEIPFGRRALAIYEAVHGIDPSPVLPVGQKPPKVMADYELGNDTNNEHTLEAVLYRLVEDVGSQLRRRRQAARRIAIILDYSDGMRRVRQVAARPATANDLSLFELGRHIFRLAWMRRVRIRHMRLICDRLVFPPAQLELFAADQKVDEKRCGLITAVDSIRHRFGKQAIRMGRVFAA